MPSHILVRQKSDHSSSHFPLHSTQVLLDKTLRSFQENAQDFSSLSALMIGKSAYNATQASLSSLTASRFAILSTFVNPLIALSAEVSAYRGSLPWIQATLGEERNANIFNSSTWLTTWIDFAAIKSVGAATAGMPSPIVHFAQANAMILGHHLSEKIAYAEASPGSYLEKLIQAESANLAMSLGLGLFHAGSSNRALVSEALSASIIASQKPAPSYSASQFKEMPLFSMASRPTTLPKRLITQALDGDAKALKAFPESIQKLTHAQRQELIGVLKNTRLINLDDEAYIHFNLLLVELAPNISSTDAQFFCKQAVQALTEANKDSVGVETESVFRLVSSLLLKLPTEDRISLLIRFGGQFYNQEHPGKIKVGNTMISLASLMSSAEGMSDKAFATCLKVLDSSRKTEKIIYSLSLFGILYPKLNPKQKTIALMNMHKKLESPNIDISITAYEAMISALPYLAPASAAAVLKILEAKQKTLDDHVDQTPLLDFLTPEQRREIIKNQK